MKLATLLAMCAVLAGCSVSIDSRPIESPTPHPTPASSATHALGHADLDLKLLRRHQLRANRAEHRRALVAQARRLARARAARAAARLAAIVSTAAGWARTAKAIGVANCESGPGPSAPRYDRYVGDAHLRDGIYHGKWQMDADFWATYGGLRFAGDAADATEAQQDYVAWRGWRARGWQPWECARLV